MAKVKAPKGIAITPQMKAGEAVTVPPLNFQVSGYRKEWRQELLLRGLDRPHVEHFMDLYRRTLAISALRTFGLHKDNWQSRYHENFTAMATSALNAFFTKYTVFSPRIGYGEIRQVAPETLERELVEPTISYAREIEAPVNFIYEPLPKRGEVPELRSYRTNVHSLRRGGFIGEHARGFRRFHFEKIRAINVEGREPLTVGAENLVTLRVTKGEFYKANFSLSCEPLP